MVNDVLKRRLFNIYMVIKDVPGWLTDCIDANYEQDELDYLECLDYDHAFTRYKYSWNGRTWDKEIIDYPPNEEVEKWTRWVNKEGGIDVVYSEFDKKLKVISDRISAKSEAIKRCYRSGDMISANYITGSYMEDKKLMKKNRSKILYALDKRGRLTDQEITRARDYPLEDLVGGDLRNGRMPCPFHKGEDNNFSVKDGRGKCFVCGEWADSIKWLMHIKGLTFVQAVRDLNRY